MFDPYRGPLRGVGHPEVHDLGVLEPLIEACQAVLAVDLVVWSPLRRRARILLGPPRRTWSPISPEHAPMNAPAQEKYLSAPSVNGLCGTVCTR